MSLLKNKPLCFVYARYESKQLADEKVARIDRTATFKGKLQYPPAHNSQLRTTVTR